MLREGSQDSYIRNRVNMPTAKSHAHLTQMDPKIRAQAFFSARVAEAHILDRLRSVSDAYSRGEMGLGEARNRLKDFLRAEGYTPREGGMRNLASTARLNLILKQNASMAHAAGEWQRMHDPDQMAVFPYVRYHSRSDSRTRDDHSKLDGNIYRKDDPFLKTHTPPWEFNCRCWLEEITAKEAGRDERHIQPPTPENDVHVDSESGFSFDPEHAFEEFDMSSIKDQEYRREVYRKFAVLAKKTNAETTFLAPVGKPIPTCAEPENLDEIKRVIGSVKKTIDEHKENEPYVFPEDKCSLGFIAKERFDAIGMQPEDNVEVIFESPGKSDYGMKHWKKHHLKDWQKKDFEQELLEMLAQTIWNPLATMKNTISVNGKRIKIISPNGKYIANLWRKGDEWVYSIQDAWNWGESGSKM